MPSIHNTHQSLKNVSYLSSSGPSNHFLPSISGPKSLHKTDANCTGPTLTSSSGHPMVSSSRRLSIGQPSGTSKSSNFIMVPPEITDAKLARKTLARKQLVGCLNPTNQDLVRRSEVTKPAYTLHASNFQQRLRASLNADDRHKWRLSFDHRELNGTKTKEFIENCNKLVLELNAEHRGNAQTNQLAVLSELSSFDVLSTTNSKHRDNPTAMDHFLFIRGNSFYPEGLGVTRYRPLTPNLLTHLDMQKIPAYKQTQQWISKLPLQPRHCNTSSVPSNF
ncbi:uncharacterized protein LOC131931259 [Physella acuta]|uniref:uncharacterized protein LOC131931259 n=1 Tax=Physella acuta TaxID=109671 RepID=UPI0027DADA26|nr:uncharacterized protein LOC131931259 [Physella acuta]